ncbi:MAG TPA: trypsin-like serine protease [Polyangia bacterium]|jgi:hypothetical protein
MRAGAAVLAAALGACSPQTRIGSRVAAITNGSDDSGDPAVVALLQDTTLVCSATLIAPRVLVTAAHCVTEDDALPTAHFGALPGGAGDVAVALALVRRHPTFDPATLEGDVAVALLDGDAPVGATPVALPAAASGDVTAGTALRLVGFGRTSADDTSAPQKRQGAATVAVLATRTFSFTPSPSQTCEGDSGGPAFAGIGGGGEAIVGVTSSGDPMCDASAADMRVDAYLDFIVPFVEATAVGAAGAGDRCYYDGNCADGAGECLPALDDGAISFCAPECGGGCPAGLGCLADGDGVERCRHAPPSPGAPGASCASDADCEGGGGCVAPKRGGRAVCAATCFVGLPGFCAATDDCLAVAGDSGAAACFAKRAGGCSFAPAAQAPGGLVVFAIVVAVSARSGARRARRAAARTRPPNRRR